MFLERQDEDTNKWIVVSLKKEQIAIPDITTEFEKVH